MEVCEPEDKCEECIFEKERARDSEIVRLSDYSPGDSGTIRAVCGAPDFRLRLMEMGFVRGTEVQVVKYAPLTDPIEFVIKGYHLSLRRDEAAEIVMNLPGKAA